MIDFELIVPDGWVQIPTTADTARVRARLIDELIRVHLPDSLPRDKAGPYRRMLRKELVAATDDASRQGARSVVLPLREFNGMKMPGSLVVTVLESGNEDEDAEAMLASLLEDAGDSGTYLEIDGVPAVRMASVVDTGRLGRKQPAWRISYYVSHPEVPGVWGLLTYTVLTDGDVQAEPVQAVMLVFDVIVSSLRWEERIAVPTEDEILAEADAFLARVKEIEAAEAAEVTGAVKAAGAAGAVKTAETAEAAEKSGQVKAAEAAGASHEADVKRD
ncbi:hypothetical protein [Streptomyces benahoarensis]|uniref:hypothetical protein n=1 Tax=Streptomyces benahoarensis TaxID=2595054 RepID=UPI00163D74BD|nr:hypothetical protein [Streptomyces benahoarensis]